MTSGTIKHKWTFLLHSRQKAPTYPPLLSCSHFKFQFSLFNTILLNTLHIAMWSVLHHVISITPCDQYYTMWSVLHHVISITPCDQYYTMWSVLHLVISITPCDQYYTMWSVLHHVISITPCDQYYTMWSVLHLPVVCLIVAT
jgi:hypothetical protein